MNVERYRRRAALENTKRKRDDPQPSPPGTTKD